MAQPILQVLYLNAPFNSFHALEQPEQQPWCALQACSAARRTQRVEGHQIRFHFPRMKIPGCNKASEGINVGDYTLSIFSASRLPLSMQAVQAVCKSLGIPAWHAALRFVQSGHLFSCGLRDVPSPRPLGAAGEEFLMDFNGISSFDGGKLTAACRSLGCRETLQTPEQEYSEDKERKLKGKV